MFRLRQKVKIKSSEKMDGRFNYGTIVGVELLQNGSYLGYRTEREFLNRFDGKSAIFKVAYVDCVTDRACVETYSMHELEAKTK